MIDLKTSKKENEINDNDQELSDEKNVDSDSLKINDLFIKIVFQNILSILKSKKFL